MNVDQLAPDEPLSPELVLVLPPELRAETIARLGPAVWPKPHRLAPAVAAAEPLELVPLRPAAVVPEPLVLLPAPVSVRGSFVRALGGALFARVLQLAVIFVAATAVTLAMALVAHALP
jgi:hypothetical protein